MPELPEVETVRRELAPWLTGRTILRARRELAPAGPKYAGLEAASGQRVGSVDRRGKFLILPLSRGDELIIHLGMTGMISPAPPADHVRVTLTLDGPAPNVLYFRDPRRFGRFLVAPGGDRSALPTLANLGPEPLSPEFTVARFAAGLNRRTCVKAALLSQRAVAGLGNIYVDEALWRVRVHPETPAHTLSRARIAALREAIVAVLGAAVEARGTTLSDYRTVGGEEGGYVGRLDAYGRDGEPCRRCGTALVRTVVAQRGTHFCPRCQRPPKRR
ncbi:MAG: DNA-formamidopyrimidine glycosylase [Deltaproteobacteria bacterium HGW-Deltaproteobacteria-14]|jgi:formamidopyrimidine-DNA glycosylase|nr:MAG: DNA-formamidopyrimidine glycosylase [Deltaproteobacteria bacterium HGW-Deltaproteobacteria-14]